MTKSRIFVASVVLFFLLLAAPVFGLILGLLWALLTAPTVFGVVLLSSAITTAVTKSLVATSVVAFVVTVISVVWFRKSYEVSITTSES